MAAAAVATRAAIPRPDSNLCAHTPIRPAWPEQRIEQSHGRQISAACSLPAVTISQQPRARVKQPISLLNKLSRPCTRPPSQVAASAAAEAAVADDGLSEGITRAHVKLIEYHGKAGYDGMANVPKNAIKDAILSGRTDI